MRLGIENVWNKFLAEPDGDEVVHRAVRQSIHSAPIWMSRTFWPFGYPEQWLRILGQARSAGIHFKDFRRAVGTIEGFVDLLEGDVNWPELMKAIGDIGYLGPVVAEMIPYYRHHSEVRMANTSRAMDAILGRRLYVRKLLRFGIIGWGLRGGLSRRRPPPGK